MSFKPSRLHLFVAGLIVINLALAVALAFNWHAPMAEKVSTNPGMRADLIGIDRPWVSAQQTAPPVAKKPVEASPRIDLKQGRAELEKAMGTGAAVVEKSTPRPLVCRLWGPLLASESGRVARSLKHWAGTYRQTEKQAPVGYVVYLPKDVVAQGLGIPQLQAKGVSEVYFMASPGPLQGAVSLGLFRDREHAQLQKDDLISKGIPGVEIAERLGPARAYFRLEGTEDQIGQVVAIQSLMRLGSFGECPNS